jgi:DNA-binding MarR family transcriptional regulator
MNKLDFKNIDFRENPYHLMSQASLAISSSFRKAFSEAGIKDVKPAYLGVLLCLWFDNSLDETLGKLGTENGMKIADLGRSTGLEPSTMTGLIDRMERDGLVKRENDINDRRVLRICLTGRGLDMRHDIFGIINSSLQDSFDGIDRKSFDTFRKVLHAIIDNTRRKSSMRQ